MSAVGQITGMISIIGEYHLFFILILFIFFVLIKQIQGLGTALKILYSGKFDSDVKIRQNQPKMIKDSQRPRSKLKRSEIVSLFNAFGR